MEHIRIYQGNQIGGCVTVISTQINGETHRIMIDYGSSLPGSEVKEDFQYPWQDEPVDAVFFTHYHGDHVGRIMEIPPEIPVYMGAIARQVLINIQEALAGNEEVYDRELHRQEAERLKNDEIVKTFHLNGKSYDPVDIPGFRIEPYSVDHSAYDAYMFCIEVEDETRPDGKYRVLHTGDFRGHGWRGGKTLKMIEAYVRDFGRRQIDALVIEGTMMSRMGEQVLSEPQMQKKAEEYLRDHKYAFLICSSTNVDSLASFYQAAQKASEPYGRYMYAYSAYLKKQLKLYTEMAGPLAGVYCFEKTEYLNNMEKLHKSARMTEPMTQQQLMERNGFLAVIKPTEYCEKYIDLFMDAYRAGRIKQKPVLIYSMWDGYVDPAPNNKAKNEEWIEFLAKQERKGIEVEHLHTSGHATPAMLEAVIKAVDPQDKIYPLHTERPDQFKKLDIGLLRDRIVPQSDGCYVKL